MARRWVKICWVLPILLWAGLAGAAEMDLFKAERFQGGPWRIKAETLTYDAANHVYVARGRVEMSQADRRITADQARVDDVTKVATLTGNVVIVMEEDVFTGTKGRFNLATRNGELEDARLFLQRNHFRVTGKVIRRTGDNTYTAEEATCDHLRHRPSGVELFGPEVGGDGGRLWHRQGRQIQPGGAAGPAPACCGAAGDE